MKLPTLKVRAVKTNSLDLVTRLARIRESEAREQVTERRHTVQKVKQQLSTLHSYEKGLALEADPGVCVTGDVLRGRAVFRAMATRAAAEAENELCAAGEALAGATSEWGKTRERRKVLQNKVERERRAARDEVEHRLERARGSLSKGHTGNSR